MKTQPTILERREIVIILKDKRLDSNSNIFSRFKEKRKRGKNVFTLTLGTLFLLTQLKLSSLIEIPDNLS